MLGRHDQAHVQRRGRDLAPRLQRHGGGIALVKGARNTANAKRYYDWLMRPAGQSMGGKADSLQSPANKTFKPDPRIPAMDSVRLIKYDFEKYGKSAERRRLLKRWNKEVGAQSK